MRPVKKGRKPYISIKDYDEALPFLIDRLGELCSYCEMHLDSGLAVEHVQPKSLQKSKRCQWSNLLLACVHCNSTKGETDINSKNIKNYLWPHKDNTFFALKYSKGGCVCENHALSPSIQTKAKNIIKLVGLDKVPPNVSKKDRRWHNRRETWDKAERVKQRLAKNDTEEQRENIVDMVESYFSIWMTVFANDVDMKRRIINKFIGTAKNCFDKNGNPVSRKGGQI